MGENIPSQEENYCLLQGFEWNVPADGAHWKRLQSQLDPLKAVGIDNVWLPPACKAAGGDKANGYDIYDLYDLGEFDQKGSTATKWGPKADLMALSKDAKEKGINLYFDAVLNHKAGADEKEKCRVQEVDTNGMLRALVPSGRNLVCRSTGARQSLSMSQGIQEKQTADQRTRKQI